VVEAKSNRFIVVYRDETAVARRLVDELNVDGVEVVTYQGETDPSPDFYGRFAGNPGAQVIFVGVKDKFRRRLAPECEKYGISVVNSFSSMKIAESSIRSWLAPQGSQVRQLVMPAAAFIAAAQAERRLIIAEHALDMADGLSELRHLFANDAALALVAYARRVGTNVGDLSDFFSRHAVQHALNGQIVVDYKVRTNGGIVIRNSTEQHLTKGNYTKRNNAARVYFDTIEYQGRSLVAVLYCGPHPTASFAVDVDISHLLGS
jgi:hypothetical protein